MKIPAVKYMRDFYPEDMRLRTWIEEQWRRVSLRAGFEPWDAPILEHVDLYKRKSGDEIVRQLYTLTDQGGRELAIRPEMTPSLVRMIAQRQAALPRPIKWFCIARMCRYERGQRGRLREFFQWNVDVLGVAGPIADAEVISVALDGLEAVGLDHDDIEVRINSRSLLAALLTGIGIPPERHSEVFAVTDKRGKVSDEDLRELYSALRFEPQTFERLWELITCRSLDDVQRIAEQLGAADTQSELRTVRELFGYLESLGKAEYCRFDIGIVRGLAYYTGPVFEVFDKRGALRAICGGGRYDQLLASMGTPAMPAVGFGLGDVVLTELLKEHGKLPPFNTATEYYVIALEQERMVDAMRIAQRLRSRGVAAEYAMRPGNLAKAMKRAGESGVRKVVLVGGREWEQGALKVRDMTTGDERDTPVEQI